MTMKRNQCEVKTIRSANTNWTRRLSAANRSRVSIRCQPCKNLPHIKFDHHAKFVCSFSYCVGECRRFPLEKLWTLGTCVWLTPQKYATPPHVLSYQISSLQVKPIVKGSRNISGTLGPAPLGTGAWLITLETHSCPHVLPYQISLLQIKPFGRKQGVAKCWGR